jgi:hypothetical protein
MVHCWYIKKTPLVYAVGAVAYIVLIVFVMMRLVGGPDPDSIIVPMTMLSLFVLSAAVMGFLFVYEPLRMYLDGQKHEALVFFGKTVGIFACFVALFIITLSTMIR